MKVKMIENAQLIYKPHGVTQVVKNLSYNL